MQNITPFLWFDDNAEEAVNFYVTTFKNSKIGSVNRWGEGDSVLTIDFVLDGTDFVALNGGRTKPDGEDLGSQFDLNASSAVSFVVSCKTQADVDDVWEKLLPGGETMQCGWIRDKFGVTWQIVPEGMLHLFRDPDPKRAQRAMAAMMEMVKLDINAMRKAANS
ncbi:MAG TPA: VOC family protein [Candidatus Binatia bacterium]|nr:VOC family protein [Candidatus Binatia bacterium]